MTFSTYQNHLKNTLTQREGDGKLETVPQLRTGTENKCSAGVKEESPIYGTYLVKYLSWNLLL